MPSLLRFAQLARAKYFGKSLSFGAYCMALYNNEVGGDIYEDSFCELYVSRNADNIESAASRYAFLEKCAVAERLGSGTLGLEMCSHTIITLQTVRLYSPNLAADLETTKFAGVNPLFTGYFAPQTGSDGLPAAALAVHGCKWIRDEAGGSSDALPAKVTRPAGEVWSHDFARAAQRDNIRVMPYEAGHDVHELFDASARLGATDGLFRPALMQLWRPNSMFTRWQHYTSSIKPSIFDDRERILELAGDAYRLRRIPLAPWTERCEEERRQLYDQLCPDMEGGSGSSTEVTVDPEEQRQPNSANINYAWGSSCTTNTAEAAVCFPEPQHCDHRTHEPQKIGASVLKSLSPEVHAFALLFKLNTDDLDWILGQFAYNNTMMSYSIKNKARRHASCAWATESRAMD